MKLKTKKIMSRKKMSELTPIERVDRVMKGVSWEDAENVGIEILARCISFNFFVNKRGKGYMEKLFARLGDRVQTWTDDHATQLAMGRVAKERQEKENAE
jgi:hypothetical protein